MDSSEVKPRPEALGVTAVVTNTIMTDGAARAELAREVLAAAAARAASRRTASNGTAPATGRDPAPATGSKDRR
jgi:hypothetical protein